MTPARTRDLRSGGPGRAPRNGNGTGGTFRPGLRSAPLRAGDLLGAFVFGTWRTDFERDVSAMTRKPSGVRRRRILESDRHGQDGRRRHEQPVRLEVIGGEIWRGTGYSYKTLAEAVSSIWARLPARIPSSICVAERLASGFPVISIDASPSDNVGGH